MIAFIICTILILTLLVIDIVCRNRETKRENRIEIQLDNGKKLVAEKYPYSEYNQEIFIGIESEDGCWNQDLAIIRNRYEYLDSGEMRWIPGEFQVLVYSNEYEENYTNEFIIKEYCEI